MYSEYGTYGLVLGLHSILRWFVLIVGLTAVARAWTARAGGRPWTDTDRLLGRLFVVSLDVQLLLGLLLYVVFSPVVKAAFTNISLGMRSRALRFFMVEHPFAMILALVLAHVGFAKAKRAGGAAAARHAAIYFALALLIILASIPWPFFSYGRPLWPAG